MVWVIHFCSPVAESNRWLGTQKLSGVDRSAQTRQIHINPHAYTCIHHRIQLAVGDMTISGWKPTLILIHPTPLLGIVRLAASMLHEREHAKGFSIPANIAVLWDTWQLWSQEQNNPFLPFSNPSAYKYANLYMWCLEPIHYTISRVSGVSVRQRHKLVYILKYIQIISQSANTASVF